MMQEGISSLYSSPDVTGAVTSRNTKGVGHYLEWEIREDKMMNNKFPSENVKAREYFGRLRLWQGLRVKISLQETGCKNARCVDLSHRIFFIICPPKAGICRAVAQSVAGFSPPRQGFDGRLVCVGLVVHQVLWDRFVSEFLGVSKSVFSYQYSFSYISPTLYNRSY